MKALAILTLKPDTPLGTIRPQRRAAPVRQLVNAIWTLNRIWGAKHGQLSFKIGRASCRERVLMPV